MDRQQCLTIVFELRHQTGPDSVVGAGGSIIRAERKKGGVSGNSILGVLDDVLREVAGQDASRCLADANRKGQSESSKDLERGMEIGPVIVRFADVVSHGLSFFDVKGVSLASPPHWDDWVNPLLKMPELVLAWVADTSYEYWQNASDILQFESARRPHVHLPKISNGLPFPLEQLVIDTSLNPGRRILKNGYIEVVGSPMWLSARFVERFCHSDLARIARSPSFVLETVGSEAKKISHRGGIFCDRDTTAAQDFLRECVFGVS